MYVCEPVCVHAICVQVSVETRRGGQVTGARIRKYNYEIPNMSPLEKHQVVLTTEQSLQLFVGMFK